MRNGESIGPSPRLPQGGAIAKGCDGVRPRSLCATAPRNSHCTPTGIEKETEGVALVCARHSPRQIPLRPYTLHKLPSRTFPATLPWHVCCSTLGGAPFGLNQC